ncbi:MAG TPA: ABC transporter substrate-binding protein [Thermoleophilaceae bacterium]|jgi:NitT/TauT family transport system substrate-binding protein|nr:ABC transporter substrate-binding protein [Thermoleophilaceae bacterium]
MKRAICLALVCLAGCGSSGGSTSSNGTSTVRVQDTAGVPAAFLEYGVSRGYFKQQKLNVKVKPSQGGATVVPAVLSGSVDIGGSNLVSILLAKSKNIPLKVVAPGTFVQRSQDFSAIIVKGNSPVHSPKDLEGKTLAINTLKNVAELTAKASLAKQGVDVSKVRLTEVDFPDMIGAVNKGRVDAAFPIEPFVSLSQKAGDRIIERPYLGTRPGLQIGCYFTSQKYLSQNGDVVKRFQRGVAATAASIAKDPKAFRNFLPKGSSIPPAAAQKVVLPDWKAKSDPASVALTAQLMQQYGLVKTKPDTKDVLGE